MHWAALNRQKLRKQVTVSGFHPPGDHSQFVLVCVIITVVDGSAFLSCLVECDMQR